MRLVRRVLVILAAALSLLFVGTISSFADDPNGNLQSIRDLSSQIDALAAQEQARPARTVTVTQTVTQTVTATVTQTVTQTVTATPTTSSTVPTTTSPPPTTSATSPPPAVTTLQGSCPLPYTWDQAHGGCPSARTTSGSGLLTFKNIREDNWEDGWKPREQPAFSGSATILTQNVYGTRIRDDAIENDEFIQGRITDSLYDGIHTFLSEQCQGSGCTGPTISAGEDPKIYIDHVLIRLEDPNSDDREGMFFKWQGDSTHPEHTPDITDSVFAISEQPNAGWSKGASFKGATFHGTNYVLWLGTGTYGGEKPAGVTFLEGQAARDKWCQVRADWLTAHGYPVTTCDTAP